MIKLSAVEVIKQKNQKIHENMLHELNIYTRESLAIQLQKKANKFFERNVQTFVIKRILEFEINHFELRLLSEDQQFLKLDLEGFSVFHKFNQENLQELEFKIKDVKVTHTPTNEPHKVVVEYVSKPTEESYNVVVNLNQFTVLGNHHQNQWRIFNNFEVVSRPLIVKFSVELFEAIYDFIWVNKRDQARHKTKMDLALDSEIQETFFHDPQNFNKKLEKIEKKRKKLLKENQSKEDRNDKIPVFFRRFKFSEFIVFLTYKTDSIVLVS